MNEADIIARSHVIITCNNCKNTFSPYGIRTKAPTIDEVLCPNCGTKRILYFGEDTSVVKMILNTYGLNKELNERLDRLETQINSLKDMVKTSLDDAKNLMTKALIGVLNEQLDQHVKDWHGSGKLGKQEN